MGTASKSLVLLIVALFLTSIVTVLPAPVKAQSKTIIVPYNFPTIQEAIDNASAGDTVYVRAGNYSELAIRIEKSISLIGSNKQDTIITQQLSKYSGYLVDISADNVTLSGFTIASGVGGVELRGSGCKIMNNNIIDNYYNGVDAEWSNNSTISENNISGNAGFGIYLTSNNTIISQNQIAKNSYGIIVDSCKNVTINQNNITENNYGGLSVRGYGPFYFFENNITYNVNYGLKFIENCNNAIIYKNNVIANQHGVELLNYVINPQGSVVIGRGNQVYYNNIANNSENVYVNHVSDFIPKKSDGDTGNGTDVVSWDNSIVGNYWSDYNGQGVYFIDENNIDHHPLTQLVDIYSTSPIPTPNVPEFSSWTIPLLLSLMVAAAGLLVYFKKLKAKSV